MTPKQTAWFLVAHVVLVAAAIWFNLAVLCQGDAKFNGGCGGFGLYIPLWEAFLAPLLIAALLLERWRRAQPPSTSRLVVYLAGTLLVAEVGFLFIDKFPVLLAIEVGVISLAGVMRWRALSSSLGACFMALAVLAASAARPLLAQDGFCGPGYAAVADSVAAQFDTHQFVFMGSTHGWKKQHDFQLCLLSRPAFQRRATDVMVEWANPVYQSLVDRYLISLEPIPIDSLAPVWIDTDAPDLWGRLTLMPAFYQAVRAINERLDPARRIRVIGGCEPIDWSKVQTQEDVARYPYKGNWAAHVIMEHYAPEPSHRLFVIYGEGHVNRRGAVTAEARLKVSLDQWFMVGVVRERGADESLIARMGDPAQPFFAGPDKLLSAPPYPRDLSIAREQPLSSAVNAVVYLGPEPDRSMSHAVDLTPAQQDEIARRGRIKGDLRQLMQLRYGHRADWYHTHPDDIPPRP